jgi:hypothetical protein
MRLYWFILVAAVLAGVTALRAGETTWKEYKWAKGKCSILLPGDPKENVEKLKGGGEILMLVVDRGKESYTVAANAVPGLKNYSEEMREKLFDSIRDNLAQSLKGKVAKDAKAKVGDYPARDCQFEGTPAGVHRVRSVLVGDMLYQVIVSGPAELVNSKDADRYLDSFKPAK